MCRFSPPDNVAYRGASSRHDGMRVFQSKVDKATLRKTVVSGGAIRYVSSIRLYREQTDYDQKRGHATQMRAMRRLGVNNITARANIMKISRAPGWLCMAQS